VEVIDRIVDAVVRRQSVQWCVRRQVVLGVGLTDV